MDVHVRLVSRSTASMADSIARVKQVGPGVGKSIIKGPLVVGGLDVAGQRDRRRSGLILFTPSRAHPDDLGLRRHNKLVKEHEATEAELYDLARKQKLLLLGL